MDVLYWLESIRTPFLDGLMQIITECGSEMIFLLIGMALFWCVDKAQGYFVLLTGFFGVYLNQFLKITCRIPRPWVLDPDFTIVESARAGASGYSFPSGHTQISVGCFAGLAVSRKEAWIRAAAISLSVLIPFSRMYLGVHTPLDVSVAALSALVLVFVLWPLFRKHRDTPRLMIPLLSLLSVMGILFLFYMDFFPFPSDIDRVNFDDARSNAFKLFGCAVGLWISWLIDRRFVRFETKTASPAGQILKLCLGLILLVGFMEGTKPLWNALFHQHPVAHTVRYCLTVLFAGCVWPMSFRFFARIGEKTSS